MRDPRQAARRVVEAINEAWTRGRPEEIGDHLEEDAVIVRPDGDRVEGHEAFVATYREFVEHGLLHAFESSAWAVDVWPRTAVVTYRFEVDFEFGGERSREAGRDVWVLVERDGRWRAAWRTVRSEPVGTPEE